MCQDKHTFKRGPGSFSCTGLANLNVCFEWIEEENVIMTTQQAFDAMIASAHRDIKSTIIGHFFAILGLQITVKKQK